MSEDVEDDFNLELDEKAQVIAEATGRTKEAVLADLRDDGIVNLSNEEKKDASLVEQLKEAAELIATVQNISSQVSENTVLNGKNNRTDVVVETTLEGDIVDRAIASVERKAEKIRKIAVILAPIMLLLSGGIGFEYFLDNEEGGNTDYAEILGCMDDNALNYDSEANMDDGNCEYEPPDCENEWSYEDHSRLEGTTIVVDQILGDNAGCDGWTEGVFEIILKKNGQEYRLETVQSGLWRHSHMIAYDFEDVESGTYRLHVMYLPDGGEEIINQDIPTFNVESEEDDCVPNPSMNHLDLSADGDDLILEVRMEDYEDCGFDMEIELTLFHNGESYDEIPYEDNAPHPYISAEGETTFDYAHHDMNDLMDGDWRVDFQFRVVNNPHSEFESDIASSNTVTIDEIPDSQPCDISVDNMAASLDGEDSEQDAITISFFLAVVEETDCTDDVKITYKLEDGETVMQHQVTTTMEDAEFEYTFDNVPVGSWHPIVRVDDENGYELEGNDVANVDVAEPPRCDITLYDIYFANDGNDTAGVWYDLDCGDGGGDDGEGFNVSIQFDIKIHNTTEILDYNVTLHFIEGYVEDVHELLLHDIANGTYCFNWVAIWTDEDGQQHTITQVWENIEMAG